MKSKLWSVLLVVTLALGACKTAEQNQTLANIAQTAVDFAANYYLGPLAGKAASDGIYSIAQVAQGYVGNTIPAAVLQASPGVKGVGAALAQVIAPNQKVSQSAVDTAYKVAAIAATLQPLRKTSP